MAVHARGGGRPSRCRLPLGPGIRGTNTTMAFHSSVSETYPRSLRYRPIRQRTHWPTSTRERVCRESNPMYSVGAMKCGCLSRTTHRPSTARQTSRMSKASINTYPRIEDRAKADVIAGGWLLLGWRHRRQICSTMSASHPGCPSFVSTIYPDSNTPTFTFTDHILGLVSRGTRNGRAKSSIIGTVSLVLLATILLASSSRSELTLTRETSPSPSLDISSSSPV